MPWMSLPAWLVMVSTTLGWAWPTAATPKPAVRSTNRLPSVSMTLAPRASAQRRGSVAPAAARPERRAVMAGHSTAASRSIQAATEGPGTAVWSRGSWRPFMGSAGRGGDAIARAAARG